MGTSKDYYRILQIDPSADPVVIEATYKRLAHKYHPDVNSTPEGGEMMREINEAYEHLSDPSSRQKYDRMYHARRDGGSVSYSAPLWLKRLWMILGVTGLLLLLRLNPRLALIVGAGWVLSAVFRFLMRRRLR